MVRETPNSTLKYTPGAKREEVRGGCDGRSWPCDAISIKQMGISLLEFWWGYRNRRYIWDRYYFWLVGYIRFEARGEEMESRNEEMAE